MRLSLPIAALTALLALPASAQGTAPVPDLAAFFRTAQGTKPSASQQSAADRATVKISLQYRQAAALVRSLDAAGNPARVGLRGPGGSLSLLGLSILGYPLDNSLIVTGPRSSINDLQSAIAVIDVPTTKTSLGERLSVTLRRGDPSKVRTATIALPRTGKVRVQAKAISFEGKTEWLDEVATVVLRAELPSVGLPRSEPKQAQGFLKYSFRHQDPAAWLPFLRNAAGDYLILDPYLSERAIGGRGDLPALTALSSALALIDVPVERAGGRERVTCTFRRGSPEAFHRRVAGLAGAGHIEIEERTVRCEGSPAWLQTVLRHAFTLELEAGQPAGGVETPETTG